MTEAVFHPEARAEFNASVDFYEGRLDGLGLRFLAAVEQTVERISANPEMGAPLAGGYRKRIVSGFPYSIIYRIWKDNVFILTVTHQHRRPDHWRR